MSYADAINLKSFYYAYTAEHTFTPAKSTDICKKLSMICLMKNLTKCTLAINNDWVESDTCHGWYHCSCIGIALPYFDNGKVFNCCKPELNGTEGVWPSYLA